jgi:hypothetical protein
MLQLIDVAAVRGKRDLKLKLGDQTFDVGIREGTFTPRTGVFRSTKDGEVIEGLDCSGAQLEIAHNNVTVRNCYFQAKGFHTVYQLGNCSGATIELCTFDGRPAGTNLNPSNADFVFAHNRPMTIRQSIFLDAANDSLNNVGGTIEKNIIIGGGFTSGAHADGISVHFTVAPVNVTSNYIDYRQRAGAVIPNACLKFVAVPSIGESQGAGTAGIKDAITAKKNVLIGGGYTIYMSGNYAVEDNVVDSSYWYGSSDQGDVYPGTPPASYKNNKNMADVPATWVVLGESEGIAPPEPPPPDDAQLAAIKLALLKLADQVDAIELRGRTLVDNLHVA